MNGKKALTGIKVADFSWVALAPLSTRFLADHGATVIRIESKSRPDALRTAPPFKDEVPGVDRSAYFANYNVNKYGITLEMKKPQGIEISKRIVKWADVVVDSFSPGVMEKWGLGYDELKKIKPDIIMASTCQLGHTGPHRSFRGFGVQAAALAGFWGITGWPDGEPVGPYGAYVDFVAYHYLLIAILTALLHRRRTGRGQYIEQSQLESGLHFFAPAILDYVMNNRVWERQGNRDPRGCPHGAYRCLGEDRWCAIAIFADEEWRSFCRVIGYPPWTKETKFNSFLNRKKNEDELDRLVEQWTILHTPEEIMHSLQQAGIPAGIVEKAEDLHADPQLEYRRHFWTLKHPIIGSHRYDSPPFRLSKTPAEGDMPAPCLGQHNEYVCKDILRMSDDEFSELAEKGVFG